MNRLVIMTVGTSLLENKSGDDRARCEQIRSLNDAARSLSMSLDNVARRKEVLGALLNLNPAHEFGLRNIPRNRNATDRLPAELSYLYVLLRDRTEDGTQTHVVLLPSDTPEGEACTDIIADYLAPEAARHASWPTPLVSVEVEPRCNLTGLQVEDAERFRTKGIPNLVCAIRRHALVEENGALRWDEVIINFTGGFKAAIPYETFAATLLERPGVHVHYLFEATADILELPQYPIGLDFPRWHRHDMMLRAAWARPGLYQVADERMQAIQNAGAQPVKGSLEAVLRGRYEAQLTRDPLQDYSETVIDQLVTDDGLAARLRQILPEVGPLLWMGDKVSMAADHAARHHHNLLEFAQVLLTPLPSCFLSPQERFVLLAALMLHDCGHTLDALPLEGEEDRLIPLFPSEVRGYHHFLAFRRLTTPELAKDVGWDPKADLAEAVAWLCFYHRKQTGWDERGPASECPFWQPEPAELTVLQAAARFSDIDLPKLVALLRIIDGCDNQSRRVGPNPLPEMTQRLFATDARTHRARVEELLPGAEAAHPTDDFLGRVRDWLGDDAAPPKAPAETRARMARCHSPEAALWTALAREVDECRLRSNQFVHFLKHQGVRAVRILPADNFAADACWDFAIELEPDEADEMKGDGLLLIDDAQIAQQHAEEIDGKRTVRDWIWEEVAGELEKKTLDYLATIARIPIRLRMHWTDGRGDPAEKCFTGEPQG